MNKNDEDNNNNNMLTLPEKKKVFFLRNWESTINWMLVSERCAIV